MVKIGPKNAEIAVLEQLEPKIFFTTQPWWLAFEEPVHYEKCPTDKAFTIFTPGSSILWKYNSGIFEVKFKYTSLLQGGLFPFCIFLIAFLCNNQGKNIVSKIGSFN